MVLKAAGTTARDMHGVVVRAMAAEAARCADESIVRGGVGAVGPTRQRAMEQC